MPARDAAHRAASARLAAATRWQPTTAHARLKGELTTARLAALIRRESGGLTTAQRQCLAALLIREDHP